MCLREIIYDNDRERRCFACHFKSTGSFCQLDTRPMKLWPVSDNDLSNLEGKSLGPALVMERSVATAWDLAHIPDTLDKG